MQPRIIFFDAHGAILDDIELEFRAIQDVFSYLRLQAPASLTEYLMEVELDGWDHLRLFERRGAHVSAEELHGLICQAYASRLRFSPPELLPGIPDILENLHRLDILAVLLARHPEEVISPVLNDRAIESFFGFKCFGEQYPTKTMRWVVKIENMHLKQPILASDCVLVSENPFWLRNAKHAQFHTVALLHEPMPPYFPRLARAEKELNDIRMILELFP